MAYSSWGCSCAQVRHSPYSTPALALKGKAMVGHQMGAHLGHEMTIQMLDTSAPHAFEMQVLLAVLPLVYIY